MTDDEAEKKAKAEYEASPRERGTVHLMWSALPEFRREEFRRFVRGVGPHPRHLDVTRRSGTSP